MLDSMPDGDEGRADVTDSGLVAERSAQPPRGDHRAHARAPTAGRHCRERGHAARERARGRRRSSSAAGVTGLTAALALKRASRRVIVLDARALERERELPHHRAPDRGARHAPVGAGEALRHRRHALADRGPAPGDRAHRAVGEGDRRATAASNACRASFTPRRATARNGRRWTPRRRRPRRSATATFARRRRRRRSTSRARCASTTRRSSDPGSYIAALESQIYGHGSVVVRGVRAMAIETDGASGRCRVSTSGGDVYRRAGHRRHRRSDRRALGDPREADRVSIVRGRGARARGRWAR